MKNYFKDLIVLFGILTSVLKLTNSNFVKIHDRIHFYELKIENHRFIQPYGTTIRGDGNCALEEKGNHVAILSASAEQDGAAKTEKRTHFEAKLLIYSNFEKTLSFLIEIEFNFLKLHSSEKIEGYEIIFKNNISTSCVQIINNVHDDPYQRYKFTIKDPVFLNNEDARYTFYFGQVQIRPLISCQNSKSINANNKYYCALMSSMTRILHIGIKSDIIPRTTYRITPNLCPGHLMAQTCILRYSPPNFIDYSDYYILLHAMSDQFESILGDTDLFGLEDDQKQRVEEAKNSGLQSIRFDNIEYPTHSDSSSMNFLPNIISKRSQMLSNGVVVKFFKSRNNKVNYLGILNNPTEKNTCLNESIDSTPYCSCDDTCQECYKPEKNKVVNYVPVNFDLSQTNEDRKKTKKSKHCSDPFFNSFSFENTPMAKIFQNVNLSSMRRNFSISNSTRFISNRNFIPRLCINFRHGEAKGLYNLKIVFNDFHRVGESTLINETKYTINIHEYTYFDKNIHQKDRNKKDLFKLKVVPITTIDMISPRQTIEINKMKFGKYFMELVPKQKSIYCRGDDECIDESVDNNQIQCVKCNRLLIKFHLQPKIVTDMNSFESKSKLNKKECERLIPKTKKQEIYHNFGDSHKCSKESEVLKNIINHANYDLNDLFSKSEILTSLVPYGFDLMNLMFPFDESDPEIVDFCDGFEFWQIIGSRIFISAMCIFFLILITFICMGVLSFHNIWKYVFAPNNKDVVIYLSIFLSHDHQLKLKEFMVKYATLLRKNFKNLNIEVIDYTTENQKRSDLLERADKIVYVCATEEEILKYPQQPIIIGQTKFHDEYNKIHWFKEYSTKTIDITFNRSVSKVNFNLIEPSSEQSSLLNSNESKQTNIEPTPPTSNYSNSSSLIHNQIFSEINHNFYLKLPEQNKELILFLLSSNKNDNLTPTKLTKKNTIKNKSKFYKLALDYYINNFKRSLLGLIKKEKSSVFYFDRNSFQDDKIFREDIKIVEPDYDSLIQLSSIASTSTRSMSNESSKTIYDANEISNETELVEQKQPLIKNNSFY
ncbi:unnamed protein product [Brachionus calyciflorus]|uniref:Uncharacterized protein n=1 Tax=Brachionus calyciflorus TaxID=104777 RepID=A0A813P4D6_9BILA|nr:unnamed protein product [Brachionus calyciflorus]